MQQLKNLYRMLEEKEDQILEAGYKDLRKVSSKAARYVYIASLRNLLNSL